ncbi:MAG: Trm112 family protein [Rhodocyclales bacterium]|nr:Trm112 family protein [Rhodocyclales bacterium]
MDVRLLEILVCPVCKGPLENRASAAELVCKGCKLAYPVKDDIPVMLEDEARPLGADEA